MNKTTNSGSELAPQDGSRSAIRSSALSATEQTAAVGWQLVREVLPSQYQESDLALKLRLKLLGELVAEVGEARFMRAVEKAISVSHSRHQVTVARIREIAGLVYSPPRQPATVAWEQLIQVFLDHCRTDPDGNYRLEDKVKNVDGAAVIVPVPRLPEATLHALRSIGGWAGLAEAWPEFAGARLKEFREFYVADSPGLDNKNP